jgi:hypothetical protein
VGSRRQEKSEMKSPRTVHLSGVLSLLGTCGREFKRSCADLYDESLCMRNTDSNCTDQREAHQWPAYIMCFETRRR